MKPFRAASVGSIVFLMLGAIAPASAQVPYGRPGQVQVNRPVYSPYLNLLRNGNPTFVNYYGLVRPEQELRGAATLLQQEVTANQQGIVGLETAGTAALTTGHTTRFLNTSGYFLNSAGQGGRLALTTTAPARATAAPAPAPARR